MKIVGRYNFLVPAQLAQLELRSHGIEAEILDENLATLAPHLLMAESIRIAVVDEDEEEAKLILDRLAERNAEVSE